jgi:hypothetical protein
MHYRPGTVLGVGLHLHIRFQEENPYASRLSSLTPKANPSLSADFICFPRPWIPWPRQRHSSEVSLRNFPGSGDLPDPNWDKTAMDGAWRAREGSIS